ncbi:MAG: hypothetical protein ACXVEF_25950 [Polyangiales bacterium]
MLSLRWCSIALVLTGCGGQVVDSNPEDSGHDDAIGKLQDGGELDVVVDPPDGDDFPLDTAIADTAIGPVDVGPPPYDAGSDPFSRLKRAIVGKWHGVRTNPWDPETEVDVAFLPSGLYTAHCSPPSDSCTVWHYGGDADSPVKKYSVFDMHADGSGVSRITIDVGGTPCQGTLDNITIDDSLTKLVFDFNPTWLGPVAGPGHFELVRTSW